MRYAFAALFALLIISLVICCIAARRSKKALGKCVAFLEAALIPPVMGNLIIISTESEAVAAIGRYIYFIGMDLVMFALIRFSDSYCRANKNKHPVPRIFYILLLADALQLSLNPLFHHAFRQEPITVDRAVYYRLVPLAGQFIHRIIDYGTILAIILIFLVISLKMPRIYRERYSVIMFTIIGSGLWQTLYIFSRNPIDRSMIGFALFGIVIYYFALWYRPVQLLDRMLSNIVSEMSEALFVFDPNGHCIWANSLGCALVQVDKYSFDKAKKRLTKMFGDPSRAEGSDTVTRRMRVEGQETRYYVLEESKVTDDRRKCTGTYLRVRDITEEQLRIKREMYDATHDSLTGLYDREYLYQRIAEMRAANPDKQYLILFLDVKNFKIVNDIFGTEFGDYALQCIAEWVKKHRSRNCKFGRLNGDTFGICIPEEDFDPEAIESDLSHFVVRRDNAVYQLLIHLGVYSVSPEDNDISVMFDRAHLSLATIRDEFKTHIAYYDNEIRTTMLWRQSISAQLPEALRNRQIRPYLQPIADKTGKIVGAEALARWIHPERGFLSPDSFIPVFEQNGMIVEVDKYMWRCACEILSRWQKEGRDLFLSVNISPKDFYFLDVAGHIRSLVTEFGIEPSRLRIEITETVMMNEAENRMTVLSALREAGFIVEMDDFGSGFSSLSMLKDMPVDVLKIDMKFLGNTSKKEKAQTIMKNIINLSEELGISSLTEGVETREQYVWLTQMGCRLFQGYYFAQPVPVEEFDALLI